MALEESDCLQEGLFLHVHKGAVVSVKRMRGSDGGPRGSEKLEGSLETERAGPCPSCRLGEELSSRGITGDAVRVPQPRRACLCQAAAQGGSCRSCPVAARGGK